MTRLQQAKESLKDPLPNEPSVPAQPVQQPVVQKAESHKSPGKGRKTRETPKKDIEEAAPQVAQLGLGKRPREEEAPAEPEGKTSSRRRQRTK